MGQQRVQRGPQCFYLHIVFWMLQPHPNFRTSFAPSLVLLLPEAVARLGGGGAEVGFARRGPSDLHIWARALAFSATCTMCHTFDMHSLW